MNLYLKDCLNKLSIVMKSQGNSLTDNIAFNKSMEIFIGTRIEGSLCECNQAVSSTDVNNTTVKRPVKIRLMINRANNDFLKDVILSTEFDTGVTRVNSIKNLDYKQVVIEIRETAFTKYDALELLSVILNSLTQAVLTTTAATRYLAMVNDIYENGSDKRVHDFNIRGLRKLLSNYVIINPIESVILEGSILTAHNIMVELEMDEIFNSVLEKIRKPITVERAIEEMNKEDANQLRILSKYINGDEREFRGFLEKFMITYPYNSLTETLTRYIGQFFSNGVETVPLEDALYRFIGEDVTNEASFFGFGGQEFNSRKYRFKIDSIRIMIQNMESNDEKQYIRTQIYKLEKEFGDHTEKWNNSIEKLKNPTDEGVASINARYVGLNELKRELAGISADLVKTKPSPRRIGLYVEYPAGWEG